MSSAEKPKGTKATTEIFRHFRPTWFDKGRAVVAPKPNGGISFLFRPSNIQGEFFYWIYVCPDDAIFSSKAAVKKLRYVADCGVKPWGMVYLEDDPILDTAVRSVIKEEGDLPSAASHQAFKIFINNMSSDRLFELYKSNARAARTDYEADSIR